MGVSEGRARSRVCLAIDPRTALSRSLESCRWLQSLIRLVFCELLEIPSSIWVAEYLILGRCRDPTIWAAAAKVLYETNITFPSGHAKKLQTIGFPTPGEVASDPVVAESNAVILNFLSQLEEYLSVKATALNYTALWDQTKPDPDLPSLDIFLNRTYPTLISKEETKNVRNPFYADYAALHDGRKPAVDPVPLVGWSLIRLRKAKNRWD